jgi:hypothetical protein
VRHGEIEHEVVERLCRNAGFRVLHEHIKDFGHKPARLPHSGESFGAMQLYSVIARLGAGDF